MNKIINNLIDLLNVEIEIIEDKESFLNDSYMYSDIYIQLFSYLDVEEINDLLYNNIYIDMLLKILYKKEKAEEFDNDIYSLCYSISNYKKLEYYEDDVNYIDCCKKLRDIIVSLREDYEILEYKQVELIKDKEKRNKLFERSKNRTLVNLFMS